MKNLLSVPSYKDGSVRLADFLEISALKGPRYRVSQEDLISGLGQKEDEDDDDIYERPTFEALEEMSRRIEHMGRFAKHYPFSLAPTSVALKAKPISRGGYLYLFLLLATRLNMRDDRKFADLDGAELFEIFASEVAINFWGGRSIGRKGSVVQIDPAVRSLVFGTSRSRFSQEDATIPKGFEEAVNELCKELGEGGYYRPKTSDRIYAKDDRLDVVVWRQFADARAGRLIAFGQCKTGTHWAHELPRLKPQSFCNKWLHNNPAVPPVVIYFLTDRVRGDLVHESYDSGIVFDRCRMLEYAVPFPASLARDCEKWTKAVMRKYELG
jgi:hypothetical protein